eukprot:jgi/Chrzof1/12737/Cz07g05220.t1
MERGGPVQRFLTALLLLYLREKTLLLTHIAHPAPAFLLIGMAVWSPFFDLLSAGIKKLAALAGLDASSSHQLLNTIQPACAGFSRVGNPAFIALIVSYIFRCSCHEGQPSPIRDLLHHAIVVALYPNQHKNQTPIQPNSNSPKKREQPNSNSSGGNCIVGAHRLKKDTIS